MMSSISTSPWFGVAHQTVIVPSTILIVAAKDHKVGGTSCAVVGKLASSMNGKGAMVSCRLLFIITVYRSRVKKVTDGVTNSHQQRMRTEIEAYTYFKQALLEGSVEVAN